MKKGIVLYYSLTGNTEYVAKNISDKLNYDLLELKTKFDLKKWGFLKIFIGVAQVMLRIKPKLIDKTIDFKGYNHIIIGTPVWAGTFSPALNSFFKKNNIENKKVSFFVCCDSGEGTAIKDLKIKLDKNEIINDIILIKSLKEKGITDKNIQEFVNIIKNDLAKN